MINKIYGKKIIVSCLILLLTSSFVYFYNKHHHINRIIIKNPSDNINISPFYNHNTEDRKIYSEINVLKEIILRNNFIFNGYKKIINHNINYQKNTLYKRVKFANLSIYNEIKILSNMKNIINIHPFNYLEIFQENNYYLPKISSIISQNKFSSTSDIKIFNRKITSTNPRLNSIIYNSEEVFVGIKSMGALISDSRLLIFSKDNFINGNVYYFSKDLNILTTYNKYVHTKKYNDKNKLVSENKFIKKLKPKSKNIYMYSKSDLSNKDKNQSSRVNKKVYISFSALLLVAGIIIVILGKEKVFNKRKGYNPRRKFNIYSDQKGDVKITGGIQTKHDSAGIRLNHLQKHIKNRDYDSDNSEYDSDNSGYDSDNSVEKSYNVGDTHYRLDNPEYIMDLRVNLREDVVHTDRELLPTGKYMFLSKISERKNMPDAENDTMMDSSDVLANSSEGDTYYPVLFANCVPKKAHSYHMEDNDYLYEDELLGSLSKEGEEEILDNSKKINLISSWLKFEDYQYTGFYKSLLAQNARTRYVSNRTFGKQVESFLYQTKLSSLQEWRRPKSQHIFSSVKAKIMHSNDQTLSDIDRDEAIATLSHITSFKFREEVYSKHTKVTDYGWFKTPYYHLKRSLTSDNITREEYEYIKEVNRKFDNMDLLLSSCMNSNDCFKTLLNQIDEGTTIPVLNSEISQQDKYIANEIMLDLRELIKKYKSCIVINHIDTKLLKEHVSKRIEFPEFIERFKRSQIIKTVYDGPRVFGTTENRIFEVLNDFVKV